MLGDGGGFDLGEKKGKDTLGQDDGKRRGLEVGGLSLVVNRSGRRRRVVGQRRACVC